MESSPETTTPSSRSTDTLPSSFVSSISGTPHPSQLNGEDHEHILQSSTTESMGEHSCDRLEPIAVVGMSCRLPGGVSSAEDLWEMCAQGRSGWSSLSKARFNHEAFYHPDPDKHGAFNCIGGHFLQDDISLFDAPFFRITAKEAKAMDPQQRVMLECAYEALENAGIALHKIVGTNVGVFAGQSFSEYAVQLKRDTDTLPMFTATGIADSLQSNRLSYLFDFRGPSMTIDTACSSSLSAMHLACQSLRSKESSLAIVGGCHLILTPDEFISFSNSRLLSPEGKSFAYDHRATSGFGRGEGAGYIILKPLEDAIRNGDNIRGLIRNSGINQDGKTSGITMPSSDAQETLIRSVYAAAGLDPSEIGYIESHGTGTAVGDPIEAAALGAVFGHRRPKTSPLYVGSLKSNIGHLEGASGVVSVIKTIMMLEKGFILPNYDFEKLNPKIPFADWNMKVPSKQIPWPRLAARRASVNNFGFGGSNAHVILENAPQTSDQKVTETKLHYPGINEPAVVNLIKPQLVLGKTNRLLIISANDENSVKVEAARIAQYLKDRPEVFYRSQFSSLALTLQRRSLFGWRVAIRAKSQTEAVEALENTVTPIRSTISPRIGFVFTGQGAQWSGMGRELMHTYPVFASAILSAESILAKMGAHWSLIDELSKDPKTSLMENAYISQPACTAIQIALVELLSSWGIRPASVVGHSSGEIAAAYAVGALNFDIAMLIAYYRGITTAKLRKQFPEVEGAMLAIGGNQGELDDFLESNHRENVVVACINSPSSITLSGDREAIVEIEAAAKTQNLFHRRLHTDVAYHSHHMRYIAEDYRLLLGEIEPTEGFEIEFHSSLTGCIHEKSKLNTAYWVNNLTSPVQFSQGVHSLCASIDNELAADDRKHFLIELGPHSALKGPVRQILTDNAFRAKTEYLSTLVRNADAVETTLDMAATLFMKGYGVDLAAINFPVEDPRRPKLITDLRPYPWNHSQSYWHESRLAQNYRLRPGLRNDILGALAIGSNDLEPTWRNIIRVEEMPWLQHHKVRGNIVYPMSGYLVMAIEAIYKRATSRGVNVRDYSLREVSVSRALIVSDSTDVELTINLRPYGESTKTSSDKWDEFKILSWIPDQGWNEHCRGLISVNTQESDAVDVVSSSHSENPSSYSEMFPDEETKNMKTLDPSVLYETLAKCGIEYTAIFQGITALEIGQNSTLAKVPIPDTASFMQQQHESKLVIHPATLDICTQVIWPLLIENFDDFSEPYVPKFIKSMTVCHDINKTVGEDLYVRGHRAHDALVSQQATASISVTDQKRSKGAFAIEIHDLTVTRLSDTIMPRQNLDLSFKTEWKPHAHHLKPVQCQELFRLQPLTEEEKQKIEVQELVSSMFLERMLEQITPDRYNSLKDHHKTFYKWAEKELELRKANHVQPSEPLAVADLVSFKTIVDRARALGPAGILLCEVGEKLPQILLGDADALSIMMENSLLDDYYKEQEFLTRSYLQAAAYVSLLAHQNPHLKILEIGSGTGGMTIHILQSLESNPDKAPRFLKYEFTDISSGFFDKAKETLESWGRLIDYRIFDVEKDPVEQGFNCEDYDLVIAANVLHATRNMNKTMQNLRKLLKPGGKLITLEETVKTLRRFPFATLPGWWLSEEETRQDGPLLSESEWDALLKVTGFSGLDTSLQDYPGEEVHTGSLMLSTALSTPKFDNPHSVVIISSKESSRISLSNLGGELTSVTGSSPVVLSMSEAAAIDLSNRICVFLDELESPFLTEMESERLSQVQKLCQAKGLLWVVEGAYMQSENPNTNMVLGLARTIRSENASVKFATLDLDQRQRLSANDTTGVVIKVFTEIFQSGLVLRENDLEYSERNGILYVPRLVKDSKLDGYIQRQTQGLVPERQRYFQEARSLTLRVGAPGSLDSFFFEDQRAVTTELKEDEVLIEIKAMGLNFKDVLIALGQIEDHMGKECTGIITDVGGKVTNLQKGDRVCALPRESYSTYARCDSSAVVKISDEMSFAIAASIPVVYCTAYYSLIDLAHLQRGESVLVHAAAGGVGQAAIMLAQMIGAEVFATVGSKQKKHFLMDTYGLAEDHIYSSRTSAFGKSIRGITKNRGVDVVLNSLSGEKLLTSWTCLAKFGRFIEIGKKDILANTRLEMAQFSQSVTFSSVDLVLVIEERPQLIQRLLSDVFDLIRSGAVKPISPITTYSIQDIEKGFRALQSGNTIGKIVFEPQMEDEVMAMPPTSSASKIRPDATYLLTGGSGGLGRSMTKWLVQQGAKYILLASRRGLANEKVRELIAELETAEVKIVAYQCDVGNQNEVRNMVESMASTMPPVRGVVHGAMVLHDALFEQNSLDDYVSIVTPKVKGAWNLHECLPKTGMDFFVILSSAAGVIGSRGQAVYAGTSTFLGAFTHWRRAQGQPAAVIHLGAVSQVGYAAETSERREEIAASFGDKGLSEKEFLAFVKAAIEGEFSNSECECTTSLKLEPNTPEPYWAADARFAHCRRAILNDSRGDATSAPGIPISQLLKQAPSPEDTRKIIYDNLVAKFCSMLLIPLEDVGPRKPVVAYGLDSLVAVEIRNWMARELGAKMQLLDILNGSSLDAVADMLVKKSDFVNPKMVGPETVK